MTGKVAPRRGRWTTGWRKAVIVVCVNEQRRARRSEVAWPVSLWHPKAVRFFNGRSMNVSSSGVLVTLPLKIPLSEGQEVELNFPRSEPLARDKGGFARIKTAKVVRIDRTDALSSAAVKVGLAFADQPVPAVEPQPAPAH